jgi:hypothetical protein
MSYSNDDIQSKKWWESLTEQEKFDTLDKTVIFYRERNLYRLRDRDVKYLWRTYSGEFENTVK